MSAGTSWGLGLARTATTARPSSSAGQVAGAGGGDSQAGVHSLPRLCRALAAPSPDCTVLPCS